ncbi:hypothetical protein CPC08DRAFT_725201 [Agrocybe pediades]|nr:hypothetical protein CPC08DRAFT_725201 [Agrocybe pediades]
MPVPVPRQTKPIAHPVIKNKHSALGQANNTFDVTGPPSAGPLGPQPPFGTNEERLNYLPSWRRLSSDEARQSAHQLDFYLGLAAAGNASVIKGTNAQASVPPMNNLLSNLHQAPRDSGSGRYRNSNNSSSEKMPIDYSMNEAQLHEDMQWKLVGRSVIDALGEDLPHGINDSPSPMQVMTDSATLKNRSHLSAGFTSSFEDQSPGSGSGPDSGSSPLEPLTPFGDFVDRAVADVQHYGEGVAYANGNIPECNQQGTYCKQPVYQAAPVFPSIADVPKDDSTADTVAPTVNVGYKKLVEPLSEWVANYVWKVCTMGYSLPAEFAQTSVDAGFYAYPPPSNLASSIHSLLLSTLLQPSAVFLAVWYIARLPVCFSAVPLAEEYVKENAFRAAVMGDINLVAGHDTIEGSIAFRLVVLGCMLANKWLDDHTFSNKTWHSISKIPVQTLNHLESLALDMFSYDLSISNDQWSQWLSHVLAYHLSLASPAFPQPISRPSSNPHSIVRRGIEDIIRARNIVNVVAGVPQPVFIGIEERLKERMEKEQAMEIDLDEDGPLRDEYLPKRRVNKRASQTNQPDKASEAPLIKPLPPPAKWSPAGDEPILRDRNRVSGHYVAVQAPPPASVWQPLEMQYNQNWNPSNPPGFNLHVPVKSQTGYMYDMPPPLSLNPTYDAFAHIPFTHSRSQSLSYEHDPIMSQHARTYSQSRFDYKCADLRMSNGERPTIVGNDSTWMGSAGHYLFRGPAYIHVPAVGIQPAW